VKRRDPPREGVAAFEVERRGDLLRRDAPQVLCIQTSLGERRDEVRLRSVTERAQPLGRLKPGVEGADVVGDGAERVEGEEQVRGAIRSTVVSELVCSRRAEDERVHPPGAVRHLHAPRARVPTLLARDGACADAVERHARGDASTWNVLREHGF
jgi:hypothetical protein